MRSQARISQKGKNREPAAAPFFYEEIGMDGVLLAALPSGGSDWMAGCFQMARPELKYTREFFCPHVNWQYAPQLETCLGDTMYANTAKMGQPISCEQVDDLLNNTWRQTEYTFTKENYLAFQLNAFHKFFKIAVLVKPFHHTFPPNRRRVLGWYEHFYAAAKATNKTCTWMDDLEETPMNRAALGHLIFTRQLTAAASRLQLPIIRFDIATEGTQAEVKDMIVGVPVDEDRLVQAIMTTRKQICRPLEHMQQWEQAASVHAYASERLQVQDEVRNYG
jgi:hypothetical protein